MCYVETNHLRKEQGGTTIIKAKRINAIKENLKQTGVVSIDDLINTLNVSRSTILRDLHELELANELTCTRGGAILNAQNMVSVEPPFSVRSDTCYEEKKRIGLAAARLVKERETLLIGSGTTTYSLAKELTAFHQLYIATNDLNIASALADSTDIDLLVLGGSLKNGHYTYGYFTENAISQIHADKVFLGVDAVDLNIGFMGFSIGEIEVKKLMIKASKQFIVLCDHTKFESIAFANICALEAADLIITDTGLNSDILNNLRERNINIMTV